MLLKGGILLLFVIAVFCDDVPTDEEVDEAFKQLEKALNDRAELKQMIGEVKEAIVSPKPTEESPKPTVDYKVKALAIAKSLTTAVPKLKSDDPYTIAEGALIMISSIAENIPGGMMVSIFAQFMAGVIGYFSPKKAKDTIRDTMKKVLQESKDKDIQSKINAFEAKLTALQSFAEPFASQELTQTDILILADHIKATTAVTCLSHLEQRFRDSDYKKDAAEAKRSFQFAVMYAKLATIRELVLNQAIMILKAKEVAAADGYINTNNNLVDTHKRALSFFHETKPEDAAILVHYYPIDHSKDSLYLHLYMKRLGISEPREWMATSYLLRSVYWPTSHVEYKSYSSGGGRVMSSETWYSGFSYGTANSGDKLAFVKRGDGYFNLRSGKGRYVRYATVEKPAKPYYIVRKDGYPSGGDHNSQFIVINYPGTDIITVSCRKSRSKFFSGVGGNNYVVLSDGNIGKAMQFNTDMCMQTKDATVGLGGVYDCPDYKPSDASSDLE